MRKVVSIIGLLFFLVGLSAACMPDEDWAIPDHFTTYDDPAGLYSISYPSDWEVDFEMMRQAEALTKEIISDIDEGLAVEQTAMLFMAGVPYGYGYHPNVVVGIEPRPTLFGTIRAVVSAEVAGIEAVTDEFNEISREKVKVGGRSAYIIEYTASFQGMRVQNLTLITIARENIWTVTCTIIEDWEDMEEFTGDFQAIVRSLRVYD